MSPSGSTSAITQAAIFRHLRARHHQAPQLLQGRRSATIKWFPEIVDHWVVWVEADDAAGPYRIKARDLDAAKTYTIARSTVLSPVGIDSRTVGSRTVYTAVYTSGKGNISGRNVPRRRPVRDLAAQHVRVDARHQPQPRRVVGVGRAHHAAQPQDPRAHVRPQGLPSAHRRRAGHLGRRRPWRDIRHSYVKGAKIYVRNVARGTRVVAIAQQNLTCLFPAISGRRLVWESGPARRVLSHIHIYGARLRSRRVVTALPPAFRRSGHAATAVAHPKGAAPRITA